MKKIYSSILVLGDVSEIMSIISEAENRFTQHCIWKQAKTS